MPLFRQSLWSTIPSGDHIVRQGGIILANGYAAMTEPVWMWDLREGTAQPHLIIAEASCQTEVANLQVAIFVHLNARSVPLALFVSQKSLQGEAHPPKFVEFGASSGGILAPSSH